VDTTIGDTLEPGSRLALRDNEGFMLGVLNVRDRWTVDKRREAEQVYGTTSERHPGVAYLYQHYEDVYVGGDVEGIQLPTHYDYEELRHSPSDLRRLFHKLGWRRVVAFHSSRPMHRLQRDLTLRAAKEAEAHILLHPVVGITKPRDLSYFARVKCYQALMAHYPHGLSTLSLLPLAMRAAGPREAVWHAIIRRNYGCTHFIVGSDHASPPKALTNNERFHPRYAAQELLAEYAEEIGISMVPFERQGYAPGRRRFVDTEEAEASGERCLSLTDDEVGRRLSRGESVPSWFTYPEVLRTLRRIHPPRHQQGITLFFTGLSGSGKSTLARIMYGKFIEEGRRPVTLLDGDIVRQALSSELGFSKVHRDLNVRRIGYVASEITKNGGVAICAPIAPYDSMRRAVREMIDPHGAMIEIHVSTPLETCEARDRKGLYAKARKGLIPEFTGDLTPVEAAQEIYLYLLREGYLDPPEGSEALEDESA
jgi:sulfate adenylyltransferase